MRRVIYYMRVAIENIQMNKVMVFFSLVSLSLTLMLLGLFLLFYYNVHGLITSVREDVQFSIYLNDAATQNDILKIKEKLSREEGVLSFRYLSKEDALELFKKGVQESSLIKDLGINPLPASFEVKVRAGYQEPRRLAELVGRFHKFSGVEEVQYGAEWLQNLNAIMDVLKVIGLGIGGLLSVTVVAIIANTVRLHLNNRLEEIEIMRLVGATHGFIKTPFFLEGALIGLVSGGCSVLLLLGVYRISRVFLQTVGGMIGGLMHLRFLPFQFLLGIIIAGGILGGIGSVISLSRLLHAKHLRYGRAQGA